MARVLILGGAGFIGYHLARRLAEHPGHTITLVDNLSRGELDQDLERLLSEHPEIQLVTGDLSTADTFDRVGGPFDQVYLLAGIVGVRNVESDPARVLRSNVSIIFNTLDWIKRVGCGRLLFASTSEVYAGSVEMGVAPVPTSEEVPLAVLDVQHPRFSYAMSKMLGEAAVTHYVRTYGFEAVIVRYHNIYGPRMGFDHVIPEIMERIYAGMDPLPVYGLEQTRAFCYVSDAVEACHALMGVGLSGCEVVHVGNDREETAIRDLLDKLLEVTAVHPEIRALPAPSGAVERRCPDIGKLRRLTAFEPRVDLEAGLALTWEWYRKRLDRQGGPVGAHAPHGDAV